MTDKELLELAAKADGYEAEWAVWSSSRVAEFRAIKPTKHEGFSIEGKHWNPLADDGDALRLAVRLQLEIVPDERRNLV